MSSELLELLIHSALLSSLGIVAMLLMRSLWRPWLGSENIVRLWVLVPMLALVPLLPARTVMVEASAPSVASARPHAISFEPGPVPGDSPLAIGALSGRDAVQRARVDIPASLLALWALGALLFGAMQIRRQRRYYQVLGPLRRDGDGCYRSTCSDLGPMVIGLLRPRIVLPADFDEIYSPVQRELVLQHERCHLARGDLWFVALALLLRCLFWFNPLAHLACKRFREDQELACDAAILRRSPTVRRAYAEAIIFSQAAVPGLPVACTWQSSHPLHRRIEMLYSLAPEKGRRLGMFASLLIPCCLAGMAWAGNSVEVLMETQSAVAANPFQPKSEVASGVLEPVRQSSTAVAPRAPDLMPSRPQASHSREIAPMAPAAPVAPSAPIAARDPSAVMPPAPETAVAPPAPMPPPKPVKNQERGPVTPPQAASGALSAEGSAAPQSSAQHPAPQAIKIDAVTTAASEADEQLVVLIDEPASVGAEFVPARVLHAELPSSPQRLSIPSLVHYPGSAVNVGELKLPPTSGDYVQVLIEVELDANGKATRIEALDSGQRRHDSRRYERSALRAIRDWTFEPARLGGELVPSTVLVPLNFERSLSADASAIQGPVQPLRPGANRRGPPRDPLGTEPWNGL